jgi:hypothetical protein
VFCHINGAARHVNAVLATRPDYGSDVDARSHGAAAAPACPIEGEYDATGRPDLSAVPEALGFPLRPPS